ncbi:MAG: WecB/TagA/CpsF family glycosyltransferase [Oscillospiraceae bacterium]|jgi:N-acetylglucosaminyldiphosphoundecaprenol N-acetyl-beta-D-mannosaminyltransferase|nr:WecB/TagA/CpsF family glycosyltransferase [Oscillospiraceae bacterium]
MSTAETSKIEICGIGFSDLTPPAAAAIAADILARPERSAKYIVTPNPEIAENAAKIPALLQAIAGAELVLPDGIGIVLASRVLARRKRVAKSLSRCPGIDFCSALLAICAEKGHSVFLFGAKPGVAQSAAARLAETHPGLVIAGFRDGYFRPDEATAVVAEINAAAPDFLMICLGSPKQEIWACENQAALTNVKLAACLGGVLDVYSGQTRRAPKWMQKTGLEWLYRLLREPKRLFRVMKIPVFLARVLFGKGEKNK